MRIAENEKQLIESLFDKNGTFDGYIVKKSKRFVDLWIHGKDYRVNKYGVLCVKTKMDNGKNWFSYSPFSLKEENEIVSNLAIDYIYSNGERIYRFK